MERRGKFRDHQAKKRVLGEEYVNRKKIRVPKRKKPEQQHVCKCYYECKKLSFEQKLALFKKFYDEISKIQGTYLMGLISIANIKRRRHGQYEDPVNSRRQATVAYTVPDGNGNFLQVCKKTFADIFCLGKKRLQTIITKKKMGENTFKDRRTNHKAPHFGIQDQEQVRQHILSIPKDESHYSRAKSQKEYISPDLNHHRLYKAFKAKFPNSPVTYRYYVKIFKKDFPNLSFHRPRVDTCHTCDKLVCEIKVDSRGPAKAQLELHHRKVERSFKRLKSQTIESQQPGSETCCISFDMQQVMFVPTLTHSDMFYLSQLSCYNLGIHVADINHAYMCVWNESVAGRGGDEVASCLLRALNSGITGKRNLTLWSDNCAGQNKNRMVIFVLIFLVVHGVFDSIEYNFLISGHSYMPCDRDFGLIEKRKRVMTSMVPKDLHEVVRSAKYSPQFEIIDMVATGFFDVKDAADTYLNTKKLNISKVVTIKFDISNPTLMKTKETFSDLETWKETMVLKKGVTLTELKRAELRVKPEENKISDNKKKSLILMIPFLKNEIVKNFYRRILGLTP